MKFFKIALLLCALMFVTSYSYGKQAAQKDTVNVDSAIAEIKVFDKAEPSLDDSLQVAKESVPNEDIKDVLGKAQEAIKNMPQKGASIQDWISWIGGALLILSAGIGYIIGLFRPQPASTKKKQ